MRRFTTLLAAALLAGTALAETVMPSSFEPLAANTAQGIETLFEVDSQGMYLEPNTDGPNGPNGTYTVGLEVTGYFGTRPEAIAFGISSTAYSNSSIDGQIMMFNFMDGVWKPVASQTIFPIPAGGNQRPFEAPTVFGYADARNYMDPFTGEVRARMIWTSPDPIRTAWVDFTGWHAAR